MMEGASNPPESFYMFLGPYGQKTAHYWRILSREVLKSRADACVHVLAVGLFHREASVKKNMFVALLLALATAGTAAAQPAAFNDIGVTMGHWHIASKDVEANKKLFLAMGGKLFMPGGNPLIMFPGLYINLVLGDEKGEGGTEGSVVNHVGFIVNNVQERVAQWKAAGVAVLPGNNNRLDQAFVLTREGVRIKILEDKMQPMPVRNEHVHLSVPEAEIPKAQAWYAKTF